MRDHQRELLDDLVDASSWSRAADELSTRDPLSFPDYDATVAKARAGSGADEAVTAGAARIGGHEVEVAVFHFGFIGGSMGEVAGERIARAFERAARRGVPFVLVSRTGGARMQEGMRSLVQMPKLVAARLELASARQPYIAILGDPTTGGVLASAGALGDVTFALAGATVGFAGPRVAERFLGRPLEAGSHDASSALEHGLVDAVVEPSEMRASVARALEVLRPDEPRRVAPSLGQAAGVADGWDAVQRARSAQRPGAPQLARGASDALIELRGDRQGQDDRAVFAALARLRGRRTAMLALDREHFPGPAGYRKARRCIRIASRLRIPVVTLVDTRGADPGEKSEAGGIAWEIAALFEDMLSAPVPVLSVVTGEGGSGGALAFASADRLLVYADSIFSVIGVEAAAEILWRDARRAPDAARVLKLTAQDLVALGIADDVVAEPLSAESLKDVLTYHLAELATDDGTQDGSQRRRARWRHGN